MGSGNDKESGPPQNEDYDKEWEQCLASTTKFDGYLVDLRKYGFSLLTGLTAGSSFLGFAPPSQLLQIGVIIVTMILVVVLYWVDVYYQNLLFGSVLRTRFLELFRLNRGLSNYISALAGTRNLSNTVPLLYGGFIVGLLVLGMIVVFNAHCGALVSTTSNSTAISSATATNLNKCFGDSIARIPFITGLLFGFTVATSIVVGWIYYNHERERMRRVKMVTSKYEEEFEKFNNTKAEADRIEKEVMGDLFGYKRRSPAQG